MPAPITATVNAKTGPGNTVNTTINDVTSVNINWAANTVEITYSSGEVVIVAINDATTITTTNGTKTFTMS